MTRQEDSRSVRHSSTGIMSVHSTNPFSDRVLEKGTACAWFFFGSTWNQKMSRLLAAVVSSQNRISYFTVLGQLGRCRIHRPPTCCCIFSSFVRLINWGENKSLGFTGQVCCQPALSPAHNHLHTHTFAAPELFFTLSPSWGNRAVWSWPNVSAIFFQDGARRSHRRPRGEEALSGTAPL